MDCKLIHVQQDTDEWYALRRTRITASRLADVMAKPGTKRYDGYMNEITLELLGHTEVEESPEWFRHGREMEPNALRLYGLRYKKEILHDCFLVHKDYDWLGASPDILESEGGENPDAGGEVKCRKLYKNYRDAIARGRKFHEAGNPLGIPEPGYRFQIQGGMWLTGFDYWWYVNYYEDKHGDVRIGRARIPRDQALIDQMEERCLAFMKECYERAGLA